MLVQEYHLAVSGRIQTQPCHHRFKGHMAHSYRIFVNKASLGHFPSLPAFQIVTLVIALHHVKIQFRSRYGDVLGVCGVQGGAGSALKNPPHIGHVVDQFKGLRPQLALRLMAKNRRLPRLQYRHTVRADFRFSAQRHQKIPAAHKADARTVLMDFPQSCGIEMIGVNVGQKHHSQLLQILFQRTKGHAAVDEVHAVKNDGIPPGAGGDDITGHSCSPS